MKRQNHQPSAGPGLLPPRPIPPNPYDSVDDPLELARMMRVMVQSHEGFAWAAMMEAGAKRIEQLMAELRLREQAPRARRSPF